MKKNKNYFENIKKTLVDLLEEVEENSMNDDSIYGLSTSFSSLDNITGGMHAGDLVVIAGRPSMGKTSLATSMMVNIAVKDEKSIAYFSMECSKKELVVKMTSFISRINSSKIRSGNLLDEEWPRVGQANHLLSKTNIFINDSPSLSAQQIAKRAKYLNKKNNLDLIIVDYVQLMQTKNPENRYNEIAEITRILKSLAKELGIPVVVLSQLNRQLEQRPNKRPVAYDLRDSGALEDNADIILFLFRDEIYNEDSIHKGKMEINIAKNRHGRLGMAPMLFMPEFNRVEEHK